MYKQDNIRSSAGLHISFRFMQCVLGVDRPNGAAARYDKIQGVVALAVPGWILHLTKLDFLVGTSPTHPLHIVYVLYNRGSHMSYFRLYFSYIVYKMAVYDVWPSCHIIIINDATQGSLTYIQSHSGYLYLDVMAVLLHMANEFRACTISNGWSLLCRRRTVACLQLHDRKWRLKCLTV